MNFFMSLKKKKKSHDHRRSEGPGKKKCQIRCQKSTSSKHLPHVKYEIMFKIPTTITKYIIFTSINSM